MALKIKIVLASVIALASAPIYSADQSATACLYSADSSKCLADKAFKLLSAEKNAAFRVNGYTSLISALTKAGLRRDDIFTASDSGDLESASMTERWSLSIARRGYAMRFLDAETGLESLEKLEAIASLLRSRVDGFERLQIIDSACETREGIPANTLVKWEGLLDRLCRIDPSDMEAMEKEFPGLSMMASPMVDAYNKDSKSLGNSLSVSFEVLAQYETLLQGKTTQKEREAMRGALFLGHFMNAIALATANQGASANKALDTAMGHLAKAPSLVKSPEFASFIAYESWIKAKTGHREDAIKSVHKTLNRVDRMHKVPASEKVLAIATSIETLDILNSEH